MSRIEDLERRLAQDPNSKVFAQLAEEYRKAGMLEEAIATCRDGLSKHPNYFSARVALGRALLEAGSLEDASQEFEQVLSLVPENISANRFLAETYHKLGRLEDALLKYRVTHTLAPDDPEVRDLLNQVEDELEQASAAPPPASPSAPPQSIEDPGAFDFGADETQAEEPSAASQGFEASFFEEQATSAPPPPPTVTPPEFGPEGESVFEFDEEETATAEGQATVGAEERTSGSPPPSDSTAFERTLVESEEELSPPPAPGDSPPSIAEPSPPVEPSPPPVGAPPERSDAPADPIREAPPARKESVTPPSTESVESKPANEIATSRLGELYASQGHLDRALAVYQQLLASRPEDLKLRERVEELQMLIQAAEDASRKRASTSASPGSEQELLGAIRKLEGWLAAIRQS